MKAGIKEVVYDAIKDIECVRPLDRRRRGDVHFYPCTITNFVEIMNKLTDTFGEPTEHQFYTCDVEWRTGDLIITMPKPESDGNHHLTGRVAVFATNS